MQSSGRTPCGALSENDIGRAVHLAGWVDALRDHGDVLFIHLRDRSGLVQVVFSPEHSSAELCGEASHLRSEFCVALEGTVIRRQEGTENPNIETGTIEVTATSLSVLSTSETLPFPVSEKAMVLEGTVSGIESISEDLRLQYRYLDLRRPSMQDHFIKRHRIFSGVRRCLDEQGFIEIETPVLTKSTPEGARDYLVPSRIHPGHFYALPQSPQLFKQLLMAAGFERYYQFARCFRDEDLRPNRQPEFTQLDMESSFIDEEFIYGLLEELTARMFREGGIELSRPFPRLTWHEAMETAGTDRPDLRFGLRFVDATSIFRDTSYSIFKQVLGRGGVIKGLTVTGKSDELSKNVLQNEYAKQIVPALGGKGMTWMRVTDGKLDSNIVQFFSDKEREEIMRRFDARDGDVIVMIADPEPEVVASVLGRLRLHLAERLDLIPRDAFSPVWITEFPLFQATDEGVTSNHHPFTAPDRTDFDPANREELLSLKSRAYDLVVNGEELGGGSIRINNRDVQNKIFQALGLTADEVREKFGFFLRAFDYGLPPHGGLALGMDRVVAMILGTPSIRDVIAFPKNRSAYCPLTEAPSPVTREQLAELALLTGQSDATLPGSSEKADLVHSLSWVSRIGLDDDERSAIEQALDEARNMAETIRAAAGSEEPLFSLAEGGNRLRQTAEPRRHPSAESKEIFKNAPSVKGDFFKTVTILE
ncbi:MAG: aspartyl-tRNA amidotransferase [delta proteobacterium MLS_D]|jgi:aspartyl-tRNA synthetase|nr:MAG: aspartyl-tRNA amidotransferase [delta proteobacterium MLS_D]